MSKIAIFGYGEEAGILTVLGYPFEVLLARDLLKDEPFASYNLLIFPSRMFFWASRYGIELSRVLRLEMNKISSFVERGNVLIAFPGRVIRSDFVESQDQSFLLPFDIRFKPTFRYSYTSNEVSHKSEFLRDIDAKEIFTEMAHVGYFEYVEEPYQTILRRKDHKPIFIEKNWGLGRVVISAIDFRPSYVGQHISLSFHKMLIDNALRKSKLPILPMKELDLIESFSPSAFMELCKCMQFLKDNNIVESAKTMRKAEELFLKFINVFISLNYLRKNL